MSSNTTRRVMYGGLVKAAATRYAGLLADRIDARSRRRGEGSGPSSHFTFGIPRRRNWRRMPVRNRGGSCQNFVIDTCCAGAYLR